MELNISVSSPSKDQFKDVVILGIIMALISSIGITFSNQLHIFSMAVAGVFMLFQGVLRLMFANSPIEWGSTSLRYTYAILLLVAGMLIFANPRMETSQFCWFFIIYFIIDGIIQILYGLSHKKEQTNYNFVISGALSIVFAIIILFNLETIKDYHLGVYLGLKLLVDGVMLAIAGRAAWLKVY